MSIEMNTPVAELVNDDAMPVTQAQILSTDYEGDESAEFYCQYINTINYFESFLDDPEKLCLPDEDGEIPYVIFMEMMSELTGYKWAKRTWNRMERRTAGIAPAERLTQLQKSEHPDYKDWCCPKCLHYYKGEKQLKLHMERDICQERNTGLFVKAMKNKLPKAKFYHTALVLNDLIAKAELYKKSIEPELEEEEVEEEPEEVYKVKLFWLEEGGEWTSYYPYLNQETEEDEDEWTDLAKAEEAFNYAWTYWSGEAGEELIGVALVKVKNGDDNSYEIIEERSVDNKDYTKDEDSEDEDTEVNGTCFECGCEGKFIGKEGDEWLCINCV